MSVKYYSANDYLSVVGGLPINSGRGDDQFAKVSNVSKRFSVKTGIDGQSTVSENRDSTVMVELTLMQTSDGNDLLSALMIAAELKGSAAIVPVLFKDLNGTSTVASLEGLITGWPEENFAKEAGTKVWEIAVLNPKRFAGGNSGT